MEGIQFGKDAEDYRVVSIWSSFWLDELLFYAECDPHVGGVILRSISMTQR